MGARFCSHCGAERAPNAAFCSECGHRFGTEPTDQPTPTSVPQGISEDDAKRIAKATEKEKSKRGCFGCLGVLGIIAVVAIGVAAITERGSDTNEDSSIVATATLSAAFTEEPDSAPTEALDSQLVDATEEFELAGEVIIFHPTNFTQENEGQGTPCQGAGNLADLVPGASVIISPDGADPIVTELGPGEISAEGNCWMKFTPMLPEVDSYLFEIGEREPILRDQDPPLFEGDGQGGAEGWWISFAWDSKDDPTVRQ